MDNYNQNFYNDYGTQFRMNPDMYLNKENHSDVGVPDMSIKVTDISDLRRYSAGNIVRLPDFAEGQPFVARLKRPSLLALTASKKIPNTLLSAAGELFNGSGKVDADDENALADLYNVCKIICESSLVQPTLQEIESAGLELTDEQMIAIFNYSQQGVKALEPFREEQKNN